MYQLCYKILTVELGHADCDDSVVSVPGIEDSVCVSVISFTGAEDCTSVVSDVISSADAYASTVSDAVSAGLSPHPESKDTMIAAAVNTACLFLSNNILSFPLHF